VKRNQSLFVFQELLLANTQKAQEHCEAMLLVANNETQTNLVHL
jgi:hypothetical protein